MTKITGSCLCGEISYEGDADIKMVINCHCSDCQSVTGSVHGTMLFVEEDKITVSGSPSEFKHGADSGNTLTKVFCGKCGSQLMGRNTARAGVIGLRAGPIDQKELITPGMDIYCDSAIASTPMSDGTKKFPQMPQ